MSDKIHPALNEASLRYDAKQLNMVLNRGRRPLVHPAEHPTQRQTNIVDANEISQLQNRIGRLEEQVAFLELENSNLKGENGWLRKVTTTNNFITHRTDDHKYPQYAHQLPRSASSRSEECFIGKAISQPGDIFDTMEMNDGDSF
jgi:hypothetical protein